MLRRRGVYFAAALLAPLIVTTLATSLASATPDRAIAGPGGSEPSSCRPESSRVEGGDTVSGPICGSRYDDALRSKRGGKDIWAFQGKDTITARNGKVDEIHGGPGVDTATVDAKDTVWGDVDKCPPLKRCPRAATSVKRLAASQVNFPYDEPIVVCDVEPGTDNRRMWIALEPRMRAADTTSRVDWQTVAYRVVLYRHDGTDWRLYKQSIWLFDRTFDTSETRTPFTGNFWRHLRTKERRQFLSFYADDVGTYRMSAKYYWYRTRSVREREIEDPVDYHFGEFETDDRNESCTFPY